jgi:hypothetical protein
MEAVETHALRDLIARYGDLRAGDAGTAQARGRALNSVVAAVLRWWGIEAKVGVQGSGGRDEIDVVFAVDQTRFILEAKWLKDPVDADPVAKLADRIRSRAAGTRGVLLSMSGYTRPVLDAAEHNKWPDILLLDRAHFEAMLCGVADPASLLGAILDHASYRGGSYATLTELLTDRRPEPPPVFVTVPPAALPWPILNTASPGVTARAVLAGAGSWPEISGMACGPDGTLLLTVPGGVITANPRTGATSWALCLAGCRGTPAVWPDGTITAVCGYAVVTWRDGTLAVAGGGFTGQSSLLPGPGPAIWVSDYSGQLTLTRLGDGPGEEERHEIDFPAHVWKATWLGDRRFFLAASGHSAVIDLDQSTIVARAAWIPTPHPDPAGALTTQTGMVLTAGRGGTGVRGVIHQTSLASRDSEPLADLSVNDTGDLAITSDGQVFLAADMRGNSPGPHPVLIQLTGLPAERPNPSQPAGTVP